MHACKDRNNSRSLRPPPPKIPRPAPPPFRSLERSLVPPRWPIVQGNFQQYHLHHHHDNGLHQQRDIVPGAGPVEDLENGGREHDEGDIEGEAGGGAGAVDGEDLIGVGYYRGEDQTEE